MLKRLPTSVVLSGFCLVAIVVIVVSQIASLRAFGQAPVGDAPVENSGQIGRYQISAWGCGQPDEGKLKLATGVFVIDTQTGDLYSSVNDEPPKRIGSVGKK